MDILLVNPNRFRDPPVIPIGLEYIAQSLLEHDHRVDILDLCLSTDVNGDIAAQMTKKQYGLIGVTIRNIDSVLFFNQSLRL